MKTLIQNARLLNPASQTDQITDILVENGTVTKIAPKQSAADAEVVNADGKWLLPGLVDIHVHLREPGFESKETIETGTRAAAAGGVTSVVCMANTNPPLDNKTEIEFVLDRVDRTGCVRVYPIGTVTKGMVGKELSPIGEMVEAGAVAFSDDGKGVMDAILVRRIMEYSTIFGVPIITHAEDHTMTENRSMNEGKMSITLGLLGIPKEAESVQVARDLLMAKKTGAHVHIAHISSAESVDLLRFYKKKGVHCTGETAPHYLLLTEEAVDNYNTNAKMNPPLRTAEDQVALYEGLRDGTIDCIATDHAPHTVFEKNQEFPLAPFGILGLETLLPLLLNDILSRSEMELLDLLSLVTNKAAEIINLPGGNLSEGQPADMVLWNPEPDYCIDAEKFYSKSRNTPFQGWTGKGQVEKTWVGGKLVFPFENK